MDYTKAGRTYRLIALRKNISVMRGEDKLGDGVEIVSRAQSRSGQGPALPRSRPARIGFLFIEPEPLALQSIVQDPDPDLEK